MEDMEHMAEELLRLRADDLTPQELVEAASSPLEVVRAAVACHPQTPRQTLLELVNDEVLEVVVAVAHNANRYVEVTQALLELDDDEIREHVLVCSKPNAVHTRVASSGDYDDVYRILRNDDVSGRTLTRIYDRARNEEFGVCRDTEALRMLISHPNTDTNVRQDIYENGDPVLAVFFASSIHTPTGILEHLLSHSDPMVSLLAAVNPSLPLHVQDQYQAETGIHPDMVRVLSGMKFE